MALLDDIADEGDGAAHRAPDAAGQPDHLAAPVADGADAVQRPLDPCPVVSSKLADALDDIGDIFGCDGVSAKIVRRVGVAGLGQPPQVKHDLEQLVGATLLDGHTHARGQRRQSRLEIIGHHDLTDLALCMLCGLALASSEPTDRQNCSICHMRLYISRCCCRCLVRHVAGSKAESASHDPCAACTRHQMINIAAQKRKKAERVSSLPACAQVRCIVCR